MDEFLLKLGTEVRLKTSGRQSGHISGYGFNTSGSDNVPYSVYLIELERGYYNPERNIYTSTLVCSIRAVEVIKH